MEMWKLFVEVRWLVSDLKRLRLIVYMLFIFVKEYMDLEKIMFWLNDVLREFRLIKKSVLRVV